MGIETEYGILEPGRPTRQPHAAVELGRRRPRAGTGRVAGSRRAGTTTTRTRCTTPAGSGCERASAHPSMLTDDPAHGPRRGRAPVAGARRRCGRRPAGPRPATTVRPTLEELARPAVEEYDDPSAANVILTNGARLYVDHAHPEYSSPEVTGPLDAVRWDRAGEVVMLASVRDARADPRPARRRAVQEQRRRQGRQLRHPRELPRRPGGAVRRLARRPHAVPRHPAGVHGRRPRRASARAARSPGFQLSPARGLHRGRDRPGDDAAPAHRQHPRRAARGPGALAPPARHHRRREPARGRRPTSSWARRRWCCGCSSRPSDACPTAWPPRWSRRRPRAARPGRATCTPSAATSR